MRKGKATALHEALKHEHERVQTSMYVAALNGGAPWSFREEMPYNVM
jgi:hypothetical protein